MTEHHSSVGSVADLRTGSLVRSPDRPIFFLRIDDSHCDRIHSSLTAVSCFDCGYVGKQPVAWKEYFAEHWLKKLQESVDRCTDRGDITEILLKTVLNTIQSINFSSDSGFKLPLGRNILKTLEKKKRLREILLVCWSCRVNLMVI